MCRAESSPACSFMPLPRSLPTPPSCQILDTLMSGAIVSVPARRGECVDGLGSTTYGREWGRRESMVARLTYGSRCAGRDRLRMVTR
jgi:hypothetical protein